MDGVSLSVGLGEGGKFDGVLELDGGFVGVCDGLVVEVPVFVGLLVSVGVFEFVSDLDELIEGDVVGVEVLEVVCEFVGVRVVVGVCDSARVGVPEAVPVLDGVGVWEGVGVLEGLIDCVGVAVLDSDGVTLLETEGVVVADDVTLVLVADGVTVAKMEEIKMNNTKIMLAW